MESQKDGGRKPGYSAEPSEDPTTMSLSFAGCGFLCIYHAGVCAAIREYAPQLTRNKMYGASAGSIDKKKPRKQRIRLFIVAAGLICNVCMSEAIVIMLETVSKANSKALQTLDPTFDLVGIVKQGLERMLPVNAHELCSERLFISLTRYRDFKNVVVSQFDTRDELIQAILCSSFIPFYCGWQPPLYRGEAYCDGGLSDNQPVYDQNTITVSPFCGESDICPRDIDSASFLGVNFYNTSIRITTNNLFRIFTTLFPPSLDICAKICRQGFKDALVLLNKRGLAPCVRCLTLQSNTPFLPEPEVVHTKKQTLTPGKSRKKLESECEVCYDNMDTSFRPTTTDSLFPPILQKAIDDAKAAENRILRYLNSYRIFRWGRRIIAPAFFPLDFAILGLKNIYNWVASPTTCNFFIQRFYATLDFVLAEIARNNLLYSSKISRQLTPLFIGGDQNRISSTSTQTLEVHHLPKEVTGEESHVNSDDSIQRLVDFESRHNEILAHFYTHFNIERTIPSNQRRLSRSFHSSSLKRPNISKIKFSQTIETVKELEPLTEAIDSGYTDAELPTGNLAKKRKESCSSSVNSFKSKTNDLHCSSRQGLLNGFLRRYTIGGAKQDFRSNGGVAKPLNGSAAYQNRPISSDSDDQEEKFFIPTRQTVSPENGYEGESDTDH